MDLFPKGSEVKPLILKLSIVFAFSFTGFLLSQFRSRRIQSSALKGDASNSKNENDEESKTKSTASSSSSSNSTVTSTSAMEKKCIEAKQAQHSCSPKMTSGDSSSKQTQNLHYNIEEKNVVDLEEEISRLKDMVIFLQERERNLEQELAKYHGTQEQEEIKIKELESKLKICQVETRIYNLRIESLKAENQRLQSFEEEAKVKVRTLKKKLKEVEEENGILAGLHRKASILHEDKLRKLMEQEHRNVALQNKYSELEMEKSELSEKLELAQQKGSEVEIALKETESLRRTNKELIKEIQQLKNTHSRDSEELVYLKWLNACLRYELRNYNPQTGKYSAKDLNSSLSHESREKAKHLILEYANSIYEFESESSSEEAWTTGKSTHSSTTVKHVSNHHSNHGKKPEFFSKLAKLLRKDVRRVSMSSSSLEEMSVGASYQKSSSSGSENVSQHNSESIKRKKIEEIKSERKALEFEKAELRKFAEALSKSRAVQKKSLSFSD